MALSELGAYLQRHREELGWSLEEVETQTHIRHKYVEALEAGDWANLPPSVYTRGLLRNYARALGVSPASVLRMYVKERPNEARLPEPQLISQPLINEPRLSTEWLFTGGILAVAVVLLGWLFVSQMIPMLNKERQQVMSGGTPAAAARPTDTGTGQPTGTARPGTNAASASAAAIRATAPSSTSTSSTASASSPAAPADTTGRPVSPTIAVATVAPLAIDTPDAAQGTPTSAGGIQLVVANSSPLETAAVWLRVMLDDQKAYEGFLRKGESKTWQAKGKVRVRTGNAGDTQISLNGRQRSSIGNAGEIRDLEWTLSPDGNLVERPVAPQ